MAKLLIKDICKQQGIPLKIMAGKMGMSASTFTQFLNSPNPSIPTLERIASVLKVNIGDLFEKEYVAITGFVTTGEQSVIVNSKEDWVRAAQMIDGLAKPPFYADLESLRRAIKEFVKGALKARKTDAIMAQLGADEIICIVAVPAVNELPEVEEDSFSDFHLTICSGNGNVTTRCHSSLEFAGDTDGLIQEIWNDTEKIYEDDQFGEPLR